MYLFYVFLYCKKTLWCMSYKMHAIQHAIFHLFNFSGPTSEVSVFIPTILPTSLVHHSSTVFNFGRCSTCAITPAHLFSGLFILHFLSGHMTTKACLDLGGCFICSRVIQWDVHDVLIWRLGAPLLIGTNNKTRPAM